MIRKLAFSMLFIVPMTLFALRGCAAMLLREAPGEQAALAQQTLATARADEARPDAARRNQGLPAGGQHFRGGVDFARPAETEMAEKGVPGAVAAHARYDEAEQAEREQSVAGAEIDRPALRRKVAAAFEARQDTLRLELAEFRSRLDRLLRTFEDRERAKDTIIDRRVDELLNPSLRWDEQAPPASIASKNKPVADIERIRGTWQVIIQEIDGKLSDLGPQPLLWTFQGSEIFSAQGQRPGRFRLDAASKPAELTIEGDNLSIKAIYQFEGDTLTVAMFGKPEQQRPRSFAAADAGGDGLPLVVRKLRRIAETQNLPGGVSFTPPAAADNVLHSRSLQKELQPFQEDRTAAGLAPQPMPRGPSSNPLAESGQLAPIEVPLQDDGSTAANLRRSIGVELRAVAREAGIEPFKGGLRISSIRENSPAAKAGLRVDDIVVGAHVWEILSPEQLWYALDHAGYLRSPAEARGNALTLHILRSREKFREILKVSLPPPAPSIDPARSSSDSAAERPAASPRSQPSDSQTTPAEHKANEVRVEFDSPKGSVLAATDEKSLTAPCRLDLASAEMHLFTLKNIPDYPELKLSVALAVWTIVPESEAYLRGHSVPLSLNAEDLERVAKGSPIKKAVYLPHEDRSRTETLVSSRLDPGVELQEAAWQRGHVMVMLIATPYPMAAAPLSTSPIDPSVNAERNPRPLILIGHSDWVTDVAFSPNGKLVASSSRDKTIKIWDAAAGRELFTLKRGRSDSNNGHVGYVAAVAFSPDGKRVASAGAVDNSVYVWNAVSGRCCRAHVRDSAFMSVAFSPAGKLLAAANYKSVNIWDDSQDDPPGSNEILSLDADMTLSVAFSPDGKRLAAGGRDNKIKVWNTVTGEELLTVQNADQVTCVAFSPDGKQLASACPTGVDVRDATTGKMILMLNGLTGVSNVAYSPDGKRLATAGWDKLVKLWDATTGQEQFALKGHGNAVTGLAFSPDGKRLASSSEDRTVRIWDLEPPVDERNAR